MCVRVCPMSLPFFSLSLSLSWLLPREVFFFFAAFGFPATRARHGVINGSGRGTSFASTQTREATSGRTCKT